MRVMYDAVNAKNIPTDAQMVAGYIDTIRIPCWTQADWARFPHAVKVRIAKKATTNDGHVLDIETGDATPSEGPGWAVMRRAAGVDPTVYANKSTWPLVVAAFAAAHVALPHWWAADYDGVAELDTPGAVAKQHTENVPPGYDLNVVAEYWPGVDAPVTAAGKEQTVTEYIGKAIPASGFMSTRPPGGPAARITIYPGSSAVWVSAIYFWGEGKVGLGGNPVPSGVQALKIDKITTFAMPNALLAELAYSSATDFTVVAAG